MFLGVWGAIGLPSDHQLQGLPHFLPRLVYLLQNLPEVEVVEVALVAVVAEIMELLTKY